MSKQI